MNSFLNRAKPQLAVAFALCLSIPMASAKADPASSSAIPANTPVVLELLDSLRSNSADAGLKFRFRLHADLATNGKVLVPAGTLGHGEVTHAQSAGVGGRPGELILTPRALELNGSSILLRGQSGHNGANRSNEAAYANLELIGGFAGLSIEGGNIELPVGTLFSARLAEPYPSGAAVTPLLETAIAPEVLRRIGPLPSDQATVVVYRHEHLQSMRFKLRDGDRMIGQIGNFEFLVFHLTPGKHSIWAYKQDPLPLELEAGQVYFIEGTITASYTATRYELRLTDEARFAAAAPHLTRSDRVYR